MLDAKKVHLGIAPIAWTNDDMPELGKENTFEQCISEMALAGFTGSEVGNKYPKDPAVLKEALDLRGIKICNQWFSSFLTTEDYEKNFEAFKKQIAFLKALGTTVIGVAEQGLSIQGQMDTPLFDKKPVFTDEQWNRLTQGLDNLGKYANAEGFILTYHHHMGTGVQSMNEIDRLMANTDPAYVNLLFDSGHATVDGMDAAELLEKHFSRVKHVHVKDVRPDILQKSKDEKLSFLQAVKEGLFTIPGQGIIDFDKIFEILESNNYEGWIVVEAEQDPAKANPFRYAKLARKFINQKTGL